MSFKIVTDSTSDLSKGWVEEHGVDVLGLTINLDGQTYETVGDNRLTSATLLEKMESGSQPMTSQVNVGQFEEVFEVAAKEKVKRYFILLSQQLFQGPIRVQSLHATWSWINTRKQRFPLLIRRRRP